MTHCFPDHIATWLTKILKREKTEDTFPRDELDQAQALINSARCSVGALTPTGKTPSARRKGGKRKPSKYNIFIGECMKRFSSEIKGKPFGSAGPYMKTCAAEYKEKKARGEV